MVAKRTTQQQMAANSEAWKNRCLELAEANHLIGSARWERESEINPTVEIFTVRSLSSGSSYLGRHIVGHDTVADTYICDCTAATYGNACSHVGAVVAAVMRRAQLLVTVETACQTWERENLGGSLLDIYRGWEQAPASEEVQAGQISPYFEQVLDEMRGHGAMARDREEW